MDYMVQKVNEHLVPILYPSTTVVNDIEGTLYVTCSLLCHQCTCSSKKQNSQMLLLHGERQWCLHVQM